MEPNPVSPGWVQTQAWPITVSPQPKTGLNGKFWDEQVFLETLLITFQKQKCVPPLALEV